MDLSFRIAVKKMRSYQGKPVIIPIRLSSIGNHVIQELSRYGKELPGQYVECVKATRKEF